MNKTLFSFRFLMAAFIGLSIAFIVSCSHAQQPQNEKTELTATYKGYMGFTPWPYDLTEEAEAKTYDFINKNGTIIAHHLDNGIPWQEALENKAFPTPVKANWTNRKNKTEPNVEIFLSVTPINFARDGLSDDWNESGDNQPLPQRWQQKNFDDPETIKAFTNYTLQAVDFFKPKFLAIGIESNIIITKAPEKWDAYLKINKEVYTAVKRKHPNLPVFSTVQYEHFRGIEDDSKANQHLQYDSVKKLMQHSDYLALSTYKYGFMHPNKPKAGFFKEALSFNKPIAIAETGAMSETTMVMGIPLLSSSKDQKEFMEMILNNAAKHNFAFVINWVPIDFNDMLPKIPAAFRGIAKAWVHTGLLDEDFKQKPAFKVWKKHLNKKTD